MLSETSAGTKSGGAGALLRRAAFSTERSARWAGVVLGAVLLLVVGALLGLVASGSVVILLLFPVAMLAWFGGVWLGRAGALVGGVMQSALGGLWQPDLVAPGLDGFGFVITTGTLLLLAEALPALRDSARQHREHTQRDPLTGLGNRRFFREVAAVELHRTKRYRRPLSLIYLDVDGFERVNEREGYAVGDTLLAAMGGVLAEGFRASDVVARIAGDEFALLLPETSGSGAQVVAEKLRERLRVAMEDTGHALTFSMAIVGFEEGPIALDALLEQADAAMLLTKRRGPGGSAYRDYEHPPVSLV